MTLCPNKRNLSHASPAFGSRRDGSSPRKMCGVAQRTLAKPHSRHLPPPPFLGPSCCPSHPSSLTVTLPWSLLTLSSGFLSVGDILGRLRGPDSRIPQTPPNILPGWIWSPNLFGLPRFKKKKKHHTHTQTYSNLIHAFPLPQMCKK